MKHILLPTDFSDASINAMEYAAQLFKGMDCTFYVLNTYTPVALYTTTIYDNHTALNLDLGEIYKNTSTENVKKTIAKVAAKHHDEKHIYKGISTYNVLHLEIKELTEKQHIDCVIMGTSGASGLKEVFIGSQTMHVIKNAKVAVIGVPAEYTYIIPKDILFATDLYTNSKQVGLSLLRELCTKHISRLILLNAYHGSPLDDTQKKNKKDLDLYFKHQAHLLEIADGLEVLEAIEQFQSKHRIDLLVLVHNKHNFFENLLFTPIVRKVAHHSEIPFLILPPYKT
tara:strand:- start:55809 stop:56660 length:852 start_codon:yes stop_codon:yes gene_type:complete